MNFCAKDKFDYRLIIIISTVFQIFTMIGFFLQDYNNKNISDLVSVLRPLLLCITFVALLPFGRYIINHKTRFFGYFSIASLMYGILEVWFYYFRTIVFLLYKRVDKTGIHDSITTFFGTTYYSGYVFMIVGLICFAQYKLYKDKANLIGIISSILIILLCGSKSVIASLFLVLYFIFIFTRKLIPIVCLHIAGVLVFILMYHYQDYLLNFILELNQRSLYTLLSNPGNSATLNIRIDQIVASFTMSTEDCYFFGCGVRSDFLLESIYASSLYRLGVLGSIYYFIIFIVFSAYSAVSLTCALDKKTKTYSLICLVWLMTLPFTQFSSPMIETSKLAYFTAIMVSIILSLNYKGDRNKNDL